MYRLLLLLGTVFAIDFQTAERVQRTDYNNKY